MNTNKKITFNQLKRLVSNPRAKVSESRKLRGRGRRLVRESDEVSDEVMEALRQYGNEWLSEHNPDYEYYDMGSLDEMFSGTDISDVLNKAYFGCRFNPAAEQPTQNKEDFNPNDDYFTFNGYANLVSIVDLDLDEYLKYAIDINEFTEWAREQGYLDEEEGEEEEEY